MIKLIALTAEGFKSLNIKDLQFPSQGNILIIGKNESGKSTLFEAIFFALTGKILVKANTRTMVDGINFTKNKATVELEFQKNNRHVVLIRELARTKTGAKLTTKFILDYKAPAEQTLDSASDPDVETKIADFLNFDDQILLNSSFVKQKDLDLFANVKKADKDQVIHKLLGLKKITQMKEKYKEEYNRQKTRCDYLYLTVDHSQKEEELKITEALNSEIKTKQNIWQILSEISNVLDQIHLLNVVELYKQDDDRLEILTQEIVALGKKEELYKKIQADFQKCEKLQEMIANSEIIQKNLEDKKVMFKQKRETLNQKVQKRSDQIKRVNDIQTEQDLLKPQNVSLSTIQKIHENIKTKKISEDSLAKELATLVERVEERRQNFRDEQNGVITNIINSLKTQINTLNSYNTHNEEINKNQKTLEMLEQKLTPFQKIAPFQTRVELDGIIKDFESQLQELHDSSIHADEQTTEVIQILQKGKIPYDLMYNVLDVKPELLKLAPLIEIALADHRFGIIVPGEHVEQARDILTNSASTHPILGVTKQTVDWHPTPFENKGKDLIYFWTDILNINPGMVSKNELQIVLNTILAHTYFIPNPKKLVINKIFAQDPQAKIITKDFSFTTVSQMKYELPSLVIGNEARAAKENKIITQLAQLNDIILDQMQKEKFLKIRKDMDLMLARIGVDIRSSLPKYGIDPIAVERMDINELIQMITEKLTWFNQFQKEFEKEVKSDWIDIQTPLEIGHNDLKSLKKKWNAYQELISSKPALDQKVADVKQEIDLLLQSIPESYKDEKKFLQTFEQLKVRMSKLDQEVETLEKELKETNPTKIQAEQLGVDTEIQQTDKMIIEINTQLPVLQTELQMLHSSLPKEFTSIKQVDTEIKTNNEKQKKIATEQGQLTTHQSELLKNAQKDVDKVKVLLTKYKEPVFEPILATLQIKKFADLSVVHSTLKGSLKPMLVERLTESQTALLMLVKMDSIPESEYFQTLFQKPARLEEQLKAIDSQFKEFEKSQTKKGHIKDWTPAKTVKDQLVELTKLEEDVLVLERCQSIIDNADSEITQKVMPATQKHLAKILPILTAGRYKDIKIEEDKNGNFQIKIYDAQKRGAEKYVEKVLFSGGTNDQIALGLRLAFAIAVNNAVFNESFIFLDEPLGFFDDERKNALIDFLIRGFIADNFAQRFVVSNFHMVIKYFDNVIELEKGKVINEYTTGSPLTHPTMLQSHTKETTEEVPVLALKIVEDCEEDGYCDYTFELINLTDTLYNRIDLCCDAIQYHKSIHEGMQPRQSKKINITFNRAAVENDVLLVNVNIVESPEKQIMQIIEYKLS